jgi:hypothetical protein
VLVNVVRVVGILMLQDLGSAPFNDSGRPAAEPPRRPRVTPAARFVVRSLPALKGYYFLWNGYNIVTVYSVYIYCTALRATQLQHSSKRYNISK